MEEQSLLSALIDQGFAGIMLAIFILYIWKKDKVIDGFRDVIGDVKEVLLKIDQSISNGNELHKEIINQAKGDREHFNEKINKTENNIIDKVTKSIHESIPRKR